MRELDSKNLMIRNANSMDAGDLIDSFMDKLIVEECAFPLIKNSSELKKFLDTYKKNLYVGVNKRNFKVETLVSFIKGEINFFTVSEDQNSGFMKETLSVLLKEFFLLDSNLVKIVGTIFPSNSIAIKLLEDFGFKYEKETKKIKGKGVEKALSYSLLR
ncbi:MAG: GNAT family N-acetyltransferase [Acholeplasmatales bacterium]|jgi:hypothetical protein|nr:GNAT family N-acetyltransferase [Acholeplasmatales bacterium]